MVDYEQLKALKVSTHVHTLSYVYTLPDVGLYGPNQARFVIRAKFEKRNNYMRRLRSFTQLLKDREAFFLTQPTIRTSAEGFYDCLMGNTAILVSKSKGWGPGGSTFAPTQAERLE